MRKLNFSFIQNTPFIENHRKCFINFFVFSLQTTIFFSLKKWKYCHNMNNNNNNNRWQSMNEWRMYVLDTLVVSNHKCLTWKWKWKLNKKPEKKIMKKIIAYYHHILQPISKLCTGPRAERKYWSMRKIEKFFLA